MLLLINYFPDHWKIGELVYFLKARKYRNIASLYRPITLFPIFGKVFENLLLRLNFYLSFLTNVSYSQHGFVELKSTESAIQEALSSIDRNIQDGC